MKNQITETLTDKLGDLALNNITEYLITLGKNLLAAIIIYIVGKFVIGKLLKCDLQPADLLPFS